MITFFLFLLCAFTATIESMSYGYYEVKINKNKPGGITLIVLSLIGFAFSTIVYIIRY